LSFSDELYVRKSVEKRNAVNSHRLGP
jgi:hypothetical protein